MIGGEGGGTRACGWSVTKIAGGIGIVIGRALPIRPALGLGDDSLLPLESDDLRGGRVEYGRRGDLGGGLIGVAMAAVLSLEVDSSLEVSSLRIGVAGGVRGIEIGACMAVSMRRGGSLGAYLLLFELERDRWR